MADIQSNIRVDIDASGALASIKALQREISAFQTSMARGGAVANAQASQMRQNLINTLNASGQFAASVQRISSTTESFTNSLERNKMSLGQYFRYAGGASKSFGRLFKSEMDTIEKVAVSRVKSLQTQYIKLGRDASGAMKAIAVRPLALDMDSLATKTAIAAQKQQLLNQLLKQGSTNLLNFGKNTQWAGRQLMVGFTIPLGIMGAAGIKAFKEMEAQAVKFKRVYGDAFTSTEETSKMIKQVQDLAAEFTKYGVEVQKTMEMASTAAAAGKTGADLLAQVSQATRLSVLGNIEQGKALETTISMTNAFGTAADELAGKINFLNAVENQTVTSIDDLTTAIPKAAPVIKQLGGNVEDLAFFLTAMREGGINASEGANALKSGLASLINPTTKASSMLAGFGINLQSIVQKNKGNVKGLVTDFADALNKLDPLKRAQAIEQMFGKFQFARLSTLFQNVTKEGTQAERVLELTKKTASELASLSRKELKSIESSPLFKFQAAIANFKKELAPVGEEFMKAITPLINFGTDVLKEFNKLEPGVKQFVVNATGLIAGLGPVLLMTFGLIANGVANLIKGFAFIKNVFNRASSASTVLGQTTNYMTTEQVKAAAVAASLQQAHNKLTQAFNVETSALNTLITAYQKTAAAQSAFTVGATGGKGRGKGTPKKKYASGVISVPGPKGAGDIVPAMLAPGEAVIPAKMASKYSGFINNMISGNIPEFSIGRKGRRVRDPYQEELSRNRSAPENIRKQTAGMQWGSKDLEHQAALRAIAEIEKAGIPLNDAAKTHLIQWSAAHSGAEGSYEKIKFGGKMRSFKNWFARLLTPEHKSVNSYQQSLIDRKTYLPGLDPKAISQKAMSYGYEGVKSTPAQVKKFLEGLQNNKAPITKSEQAMFKAVADLDTTGSRSAITQGRVASSVLDARLGYKGKDSYDERLKSGNLNYKDNKSEQQQVKDLRAKVAKKEREIKTKLSMTGKQQAKLDKSVTESKAKTAKAAKTIANVEGKKAKRVVTEEQRRKQKDKLVEKGKAEIAAGTRKSFTPAQARAQSYLTYGTENPTKEMRDARKAADKVISDERKARGRERRAALNARLEEERKARSPRVSGRFTGMGAKVGGISMAGMMAGGMVGGGAGEIISNVSGIAFALSSIQQVFSGTKIAGAISAFGSGLLKLVSGPLGLVAVGATALVTAFSLATEKERKRVEAINSMTNIITLTSAKIKGLGDYFGITPKTIPSIGSLDVANGDVKQASALDEFMNSDVFKKDYSEDVKKIKGLDENAARIALESMSFKLKTLGFGNEDIQTIIKSIQVAAGKETIDIDFKAMKVSAVDYALEKVSEIAANTPQLKEDADAYNKALKKWYEEQEAIKQGYQPMTPSRYPLDRDFIDSSLSPESKQSFVELTNFLDGLQISYRNGAITFKEYQSAYTTAIGKLLSVSKEAGTQNMFLDQIIRTSTQIGDEVKNRFTEMGQNLVAQKAQLLALLMAGADPAVINSIISGLTGKSLQGGIWAANKLKELTDSMKDIIPSVANTVTEIEEAFNEIGKQISNLQTGLDIIGLKEDKVNDKYDKRLDALDKIQQANDAISQQQQDQLDLADAITRGDIAGAARAMQQARTNAADRAIQSQRNAIESSRDRELSLLKDPSGRTRQMLEQMISDKEMKRLLLKFANPDANLASGGHITGAGTGTSDSIPAMLSNGEYVIRAKAAKALGINTLDKMNHAEKFVTGGPVNIAKYAKGGPVNIAKYAKGGYASSDERRMASGMPVGKKSGLPDWMKWVPGLNMLTTGSAVANAINTKTVNKKDAKKDALYKKGGFEGFLAGFEGMMGDMGTNPFVKGLGAAISSNPYTDFLMSTLSLPVNMIGSGVNSSMNILSDAGKAANGKMGLGNFLGSTMGNIGRSFVDPFVSTYGHMADPNTEFKTGFGQATDTVIKNRWFGTDTAEGRARARVFGGGFELLADPLNYIGAGAAAKLAGIGSKVSKAGKVVDILGGEGLPLKLRMLLKKDAIMRNVKTKLSTGAGSIMGSAKSGFSKIAERIRLAAASRASAKTEMSPIIQGLFGANRSGRAPGISSAGIANVGGSDYFMKRFADANIRSVINQGDAKGFHPEALFNTGMQEYLIARMINSAGGQVPDLKFFPGMSTVDDGLILGSKEIPNSLNFLEYAEGKFMHTLKRRDPEEHQRLFDSLISDGVSNYANKSAVINAILDTKDRHYGNTLFNTKTGSINDIDFGRLGSAGFNPPRFVTTRPRASFQDLRNQAEGSASGMQSTIRNFSALYESELLNRLDALNIPHTKYDVPSAPLGEDKYAEFGSRFADMKPTAMDIAKTLGFDLSLDTLPKGFASKNKIILDAIDAMKKSGMDKNLLSKIDPNSQQAMLEVIFDNIKTIVSQKDATFRYANGGMVGKPKYFANGGMVGMYANGGDVVPSMLTPGEFVVSQPAVKDFGVGNLKAINNGTYGGDSMYNYSVNLSVNGSNANADDIARKVMQQIKRIDSQRVGGVRA